MKDNAQNCMNAKINDVRFTPRLFQGISSASLTLCIDNKTIVNICPTHYSFMYIELYCCVIL